MARRRTRNDVGGCLALLGLSALLLVSALLYSFVSVVIRQPLAVGVPTALVLAAIIYGIVKYAQRRNEEERQRQTVRIAQSQEIARYHVMNPRQFELALGFLCERDGCTRVEVVGGSGDLGADVVAFAPDGRKIVLQAKRYGPGNKVSGPDLQRFGGTCFTVHNAHIAAVVTTSDFTRQARDYANGMAIRLLDERGLAAWASRTGPAPWH